MSNGAGEVADRPLAVGEGAEHRRGAGSLGQRVEHVVEALGTVGEKLNHVVDNTSGPADCQPFG